MQLKFKSIARILTIILFFCTMEAYGTENRTVCEIKKSSDIYFTYVFILGAEHACQNKEDCYAANYKAEIRENGKKIGDFNFTSSSDVIFINTAYTLFANKIRKNRKVYYDSKSTYKVPDWVEYFVPNDAVFFTYKKYRDNNNGCKNSPECASFSTKIYEYDEYKMPRLFERYPDFITRHYNDNKCKDPLTCSSSSIEYNKEIMPRALVYYPNFDEELKNCE